ncbi:hypothetical protein I5M24_26740 [Pseudomonas aeruginosa]|uniref:Uncharacterized protein n=1 Tax=Ectopseudomonas oleovorans TaxID=301 RepID=A0AA42TTJ2_ECTOL|nr:MULTISPECIES: hypothetical protein [Pseudomonas aeruginosa group]ELN4063138.1 hypothetical protein [Pseudomonas aeruginosa]MBH3889174.1 hypothetical protein [Pseudomonas aeruginosa]MBI8491069.1 hypothetical protein [Pseudomonas aeruginosa]MBI8856968.1 hypothetical protein [Pseudomonas aeruginosa]MDH1339182.1 hypothetical protein [Pseudomonas oleovorans]
MSLKLFALVHAVTQLVQVRIDYSTCLNAIPQRNHDLVATLPKRNVESITDLQPRNHLSFRRCKLSVEPKGCTRVAGCIWTQIATA